MKVHTVLVLSRVNILASCSVKDIYNILRKLVRIQSTWGANSSTGSLSSFDSINCINLGNAIWPYTVVLSQFPSVCTCLGIAVNHCHSSRSVDQISSNSEFLLKRRKVSYGSTMGPSALNSSFAASISDLFTSIFSTVKANGNSWAGITPVRTTIQAMWQTNVCHLRDRKRRLQCASKQDFKQMASSCYPPKRENHSPDPSASSNSKHSLSSSCCFLFISGLFSLPWALNHGSIAPLASTICRAQETITLWLLLYDHL